MSKHSNLLRTLTEQRVRARYMHRSKRRGVTVYHVFHFFRKRSHGRPSNSVRDA